MRNFEEVDTREMEEHGFSRIPKGKDVEEGVLGSRRDEYKEMGLEDYMPYDQAIKLVKLVQPKEKPFPKDLQLEIANDLNVYLQQLSYYTAIGSPLDTFHGVDAFLELDLGNDQIIRITLDITSNIDKIEHKANVVFQWPKDGIDRKSDEGKIIWEKTIRKVSIDVENFIKKQARQRGIDIHPLSKEELARLKELREMRRAQESFANLPESKPVKKMQRAN